MPRKRKEKFEGTTRIVLVWDESGSMGHLQEQGISHIGEQLKAAREGTDVYFTLWFFGSHIEKNSRKVWDRVNPAEVEAHASDYKPNGMTPLYDAVGRAIHDTTVAPEDRALMVVFTDGLENASREYNQARIKNLVEQKEKEGNWSFVFLAAGFDEAQAVQQAQSMAMSPGSTSSTPATAGGMLRSAGVTGQAMSNYVQSSAPATLDFYDGAEDQHVTAADIGTAALSEEHHA